MKILVTICKNSNFSKLKKILLQNQENWGMSENVFWSITFFVFDLQTRIVPHFKAKTKINNSFYCIEHLRSKLKPLPLIISVQIIVPHPLSSESCWVRNSQKHKLLFILQSTLATIRINPFRIYQLKFIFVNTN